MTVYRRNPLLMTVMGANPGPRTRKSVERALDDAISRAWSRLMHGVQVPILDIPRIFRDIKLEMAAGTPLDQAVLSVGTQYKVNRNPIGEAIVGGLAGALVNRALQSNPGPSFIVIDSSDGRVAYTKRATGVGSEAIRKCIETATRLARKFGRSFLVYLDIRGARVGSRLNIVMVRSLGITSEVFPDGTQTYGNPHSHRARPIRRRKRQEAGRSVRSNPAIRSEWDRLTDRRRLAVLEFAGVPYEQARRLAHRPWGTLPPAIQDEVARGWQENPSSRKAQTFMSREVSHLMRDKGYPQKRAVAAAYAIARKKGFQLNPGPRGKRRMTITVEQFAAWVKRQRNPEMWRAFLAKFRGYENWTHGDRAQKVQLEWVDTPGVNGLWITYDGGKQPESTYIMPKGSHRKGAWKHQWGTMPDIKHDPEAGIVLTKLRGRSRITDFYHK